MPRWPMTAVERFWSRVDRRGPDECWPWVGKTTTNGGRGQMWLDGRIQIASRIVWQLERGPIPDGLCVLHRCDNGPCVNPAHLFIGTQLENIADCKQKGRARSATGPRAGRAKLTTEDVKQIRATYDSGKDTMRGLGRKFGVSNIAIRFIVRRDSWVGPEFEPDGRFTLEPKGKRKP